MEFLDTFMTKVLNELGNNSIFIIILLAFYIASIFIEKYTELNAEKNLTNGSNNQTLTKNDINNLNQKLNDLSERLDNIEKSLLIHQELISEITQMLVKNQLKVLSNSTITEEQIREVFDDFTQVLRKLVHKQI